jgi:C-terminal processing protease CtpA/Prc
VNVALKKEEGKGMGMTLEIRDNAFFVKGIKGVAEASGNVNVGDCIMSIGGKNVHGSSLDEVKVLTIQFRQIRLVFQKSNLFSPPRFYPPEG